jgi:hypothetical protein
VGDRVGSWVGHCEGLLDGHSVGSKVVGTEVGSMVGVSDNANVGADVEGIVVEG